MLPDVNVLVAAFRADHPHHKVAADWLKRTLKNPRDGQHLALPMQVVSGFLRLVTHSKIFLNPATAEQALDFVDWLLEDAHVQAPASTSEWANFRGLVLKKRLTANQIPDVHLASLALSLGEPFVTFDKGFRQLLPPSLLVVLSPA